MISKGNKKFAKIKLTLFLSTKNLSQKNTDVLSVSTIYSNLSCFMQLKCLRQTGERTTQFAPSPVLLKKNQSLSGVWS